MRQSRSRKMIPSVKMSIRCVMSLRISSRAARAESSGLSECKGILVLNPHLIWAVFYGHISSDADSAATERAQTPESPVFTASSTRLGLRLQLLRRVVRNQRIDGRLQLPFHHLRQAGDSSARCDGPSSGSAESCTSESSRCGRPTRSAACGPSPAAGGCAPPRPHTAAPAARACPSRGS